MSTVFFKRSTSLTGTLFRKTLVRINPAKHQKIMEHNFLISQRDGAILIDTS